MSVGVVTRLRVGTGVQFSAGRKRFFSLSQHPDPFWAPSQLLYIARGPAARYRIVIEEGVRLIVHVRVVPTS